MSQPVMPSYAQDKPSFGVINYVISNLVLREFRTIRTSRIDNIKIIKEFISQYNGRYCIEVTYNRIADTGQIFPEQGKFNFEKKGDIWYGGKGGWGP